MMYTDESPFHGDPRVGFGALWINRNCLWTLWLKMALNMGLWNCVDIQPNPIFAHLRSSLLLTHFRLQSYLPKSPNSCSCISEHVSHRRLYRAKLSESRHTIVFVYILLTLLRMQPPPPIHRLLMLTASCESAACLTRCSSPTFFFFKGLYRPWQLLPDLFSSRTQSLTGIV